MAESVSTFLPVGSAPQDIPLTDQNGDSVKLSDYRGQKLVLYFYPKDGSGSCLKEALSLRDGYDKLKAKGYEVVGVSPDSEKSHLNFITKQSLPFRLISDPETKLIQQFGAWCEKSMYGRSYMGLLRSTFLLNEEGVVTHVIENVVTAAHATQILDLLES